MPKQYAIEHGAENNRWLHKIERGRSGEGSQQTNCYRPDLSAAMTFTKKAEAVAFARKWKARAWMIRNGEAVEQVWPEENA